MAYRRVASYTIPLLGQIRREIGAVNLPDLVKKTEHWAVIKPFRALGAPWISDFIARRKNFVLCESCRSKYGNDIWWKRYQYRGDWVGWQTNCDGCRTFTRCNQFYPEEVIGKVLHPRFWRDPQ